MPHIDDQEELIKMFEAKACIKSSDDRGFYICDGGQVPGMWYLHTDGIIRFGIDLTEEHWAFWPTAKAAADFYHDWTARMVVA